ncbi:hypothetical protein EG834_14550 [bacterium]|nr:hypothetical protein [bacterium]
MKQSYKIAALVPMRHNSVRVPMKNYRLLAGKPLYQHIIRTLLQCPEISEVAVDTDSPVVIDGLRAEFPQVRIIERPAHPTAAPGPMNEL